MFRKSLTVGALTLASAAFANPYGFFNSEDDQLWGRTQMPDFDQSRRAVLNLQGLPNDGNAYCVPTATMNAFAYAARHGYPNIQPGSASWTPGDQDEYNFITMRLQTLGLMMDTSPTGGTNPTGWFEGTRAWLPVNQFDVYSRLAMDNESTTTRDIAEIGRAGGLVMFCYGRWEVGDNYELVDRNGGHCLTATEVSTDFPWTSTVKYRDPASGGALNTQSAFAYAEADCLDLWYLDDDGFPQEMSRMPSGGSNTRIIDKIYTIFPKNGLTDWPAGQVSKITPNPVDPDEPFIDSFVLPGGQTPGVCEIAPGRTLIAVAAIDDHPELGEPLVVIDSPAHPGESARTLRTFQNGVQALAFCRRGYLNVLSGDEIFQFDVSDKSASAASNSSEVPFNFGDHDPLVATLSLRQVDGSSYEPKDIFYDDANDEVVVLTREHILLARYDLQNGFEERPHGLGQGSVDMERLGISPSTGNLIVLSTQGTAGATNMNELLWDPALARYSVVASHTFPAGSTVTSLSLDDAGTVYTVVDGQVQALRPNAVGAFEPVADAPFVGQQAGPNFRISRSRTNYDERIHGGPGWADYIDPAELEFDPEIVDCDADFNQDGLADINDLLAYLAAWFAGEDIADLNVDFSVDINDLLQFLSAWFNGCP